MKLKTRKWRVERQDRRGSVYTGSALLAAALIVTACNDATAPSQLVSIQPASQVVVLQTVPSGKVLNTSVTVTNTSQHAVSLSPCGMSLERKIDGPIALADGPAPPWFRVWSEVCALLSAEAVARFTAPLQPGESRTVPLMIPVGQGSFSGFDGSPGLYRIHMSLTTEILGVFAVIPHDLSISDPFAIVAQ